MALDYSDLIVEASQEYIEDGATKRRFCLRATLEYSTVLYSSTAVRGAVYEYLSFEGHSTVLCNNMTTTAKPANMVDAVHRRVRAQSTP